MVQILSMIFLTFCCFLLYFGTHLIVLSNAAPQNIFNHNEDILKVNDIKPELWLTISARTRSIELSWTGARTNSDDLILITDQQPSEFNQNSNLNNRTNKSTTLIRDSARVYNDEDDGSGSGNGGFDDRLIIPVLKIPDDNNNDNEMPTLNYKDKWLCNNGSCAIQAVIKPYESTDWIRTTIHFNYNMSRNVTIQTKCYGFWASYINKNGKILATTCIQAYPRWMNEMKSAIADFRIRDLFIPGTHDSGSYRLNFDPTQRETLVTKYSLTQDDDIYGQLMHGARYIDLRIGYYKGTNEKFFVNHGITRQMPLQDVINQVIDFITETNEIVILDFQEFPIGFGRTLDVHRFLVYFLSSKFGNYLVDPILSWQVTLRDIWKRKRNVLLCYDNTAIVSEFPSILFHSVQQRWGDVRNLQDLESFLRQMNQRDPMRLSSRPVADMAELTPDTWGTITDKYGGLRKMADKVNHHVTSLYINELGPNANIVAVDFMRGTSIVDAALKWNLQKVVAFRK